VVVVSNWQTKMSALYTIMSSNFDKQKISAVSMTPQELMLKGDGGLQTYHFVG
jgi:hypothetical protein